MTPEFIAPVFDAAKTNAPDRYLSALLCPSDTRDDLIALAAVVGDIERIPARVSEPMLGEIRLQWWVDWLTGLNENPETKTGNPLADALAEVIVRQSLPTSHLMALCEARISDLYADPFEDERSYETYLDTCEGRPFELAVAICNRSETADLSDDARTAIQAAGRAMGGVRVLMKLAFFTAHGRWPLPMTEADNQHTVLDPTDNSAALRQHLVEVELDRISRARQKATGTIGKTSAPEQKALRQALRPLVLVDPYVTLLRKQKCWSLQPMHDLGPLTRVWRLWSAKVTAKP